MVHSHCHKADYHFGGFKSHPFPVILGMVYPIGSMYGIYANIGDILMVSVTIYSIHGSYGLWHWVYHRS